LLLELAIALLVIGLVNVTGWITPGPNMIAVANASLQHGRVYGFAVGAGMGVAAFIWALFSVAGATIVFDLFPNTVVALKVLGGSYIIWLGIKTLRSHTNVDFSSISDGMGSSRLSDSFRIGFLVSMTNPKAALFFGSVLVAFVPANSPHWFLAIVVIFCGIFSTLLHMITATVFSTRAAMYVFDRFKMVFNAVFGTVFIATGVGILVDAYRRN